MDELPEPVEASCGFANYKSRVVVEGNVLRYTRNYTVKQVRVPIEGLNAAKSFFRQVAADERATAILKRSAP